MSVEIFYYTNKLLSYYFYLDLVLKLRQVGLGSINETCPGFGVGPGG